MCQEKKFFIWPRTEITVTTLYVGKIRFGNSLNPAPPLSSVFEQPDDTTRRSYAAFCSYVALTIPHPGDMLRRDHGHNRYIDTAPANLPTSFDRLRRGLSQYALCEFAAIP